MVCFLSKNRKQTKNRNQTISAASRRDFTAISALERVEVSSEIDWGRWFYILFTTITSHSLHNLLLTNQMKGFMSIFQLLGLKIQQFFWYSNVSWQCFITNIYACQYSINNMFAHWCSIIWKYISLIWGKLTWIFT